MEDFEEEYDENEYECVKPTGHEFLPGHYECVHCGAEALDDLDIDG